MRDGTITTRADVYAEGIPSTSNGVITSGDSPPPLQTSIPLVDCDVPDDARPGHVTPVSPITSPLTSKLLNNVDTDTETIENAVAVTQTILPTPEPQPKIERNGVDGDPKRYAGRVEEDSCIVDCIYFTQQCCECVIL